MDNKQKQPNQGMVFVLSQNIVPNGIQQFHLVNTPIAIGDLYYGQGKQFSRLAVGKTNQVLTVSGGVPVWASQPAMVFSLGRSYGTIVGFGATDYVDSSGNQQTSDSLAGNIMPISGTIKNFYIDVWSNSLNSGNSVFTLYKNGNASSVTQSVNHGVTSIISDLTHILTVAAGDRITIQIVNGGTGGNIEFGFSYVLYQ